MVKQIWWAGGKWPAYKAAGCEVKTGERRIWTQVGIIAFNINPTQSGKKSLKFTSTRHDGQGTIYMQTVH